MVMFSVLMVVVESSRWVLLCAFLRCSSSYLM